MPATIILRKRNQVSENIDMRNGRKISSLMTGFKSRKIFVWKLLPHYNYRMERWNWKGDSKFELCSSTSFLFLLPRQWMCEKKTHYSIKVISSGVWNNCFGELNNVFLFNFFQSLLCRKNPKQFRNIDTNLKNYEIFDLRCIVKLPETWTRYPQESIILDIVACTFLSNAMRI